MENTCTRYRTELSAYMDCQLDKELHQEVHSHLANCESCSSEYDSLKSLTAFLVQSLIPSPDDVPDIWQAVEGKMHSVCDLMRADLSAYLDSELSPAAQEGVNKHLKDCSECLAEFKLLNATDRLLLTNLELPASIQVDLWPGIKARLNEDCALIKSEISSYVDQEVATLRHRGITTHLIDCADCRVEFNNISTVGEFIRDSYKPNLPADFDLWPEIRSKLQVVPFSAKKEVVPIRSGKINGHKVYLTAAAAVVLTLIGSLTYMFVTPQPAPAETVSSENYLIESALMEPTDNAEAVVYEQN